MRCLEVLPPGCQPVIVADGGFRSPFFTACRERGIAFVVRLRSDVSVVHFDDPPRRRLRFSEIFASTTANAQCLGEGGRSPARRAP